MHFGQRLKDWRKKAYLTQEDLARAAGVSVPYVSNLERDFSANTRSGKPRPSEDLCERFAKALGVAEDDVRIAAGYAPKALTGKPQTVAELLSLLDKAGITTITFAEGVESLHDQPPEALQEILDAVRNAIELTLYKRLTSQEKTRNAARQSSPPLSANDPQ